MAHPARSDGDNLQLPDSLTGIHDPDVTYHVPSPVEEILREPVRPPVSLGKEAAEGLSITTTAPAATPCIRTDVACSLESLSPPQIDSRSIHLGRSLSVRVPGTREHATRGNPVMEPIVTPDRTKTRRSKPAPPLPRGDGTIDDGRTIVPAEDRIAIRRSSRSPRRRRSPKAPDADIGEAFQQAESVLSDKMVQLEKMESWFETQRQYEKDACLQFSLDFQAKARLYEQEAREQHEKLEAIMRSEAAANQAQLISQNSKLRDGLQHQLCLAIPLGAPLHLFDDLHWERHRL